jgi:hypothetical protein
LDVVSEETQGDEDAAKLQGGQMYVSPTLVVDLQAPESVAPGANLFATPLLRPSAPPQQRAGDDRRQRHDRNRYIYRRRALQGRYLRQSV